VSTKSPQDYREEGRRVRALAEQISRADMRQTVLEIADLYERLAGQAGMLSNQDPTKT